MANRVHRESTWPRRATTAESSDRPENRIDANNGGRSTPNGTAAGAADTIFDFHLPDVSKQEVDDLHRRAEYLLDEMEMGAADRGAVQGTSPVANGHANGNGISNGHHELTAPTQPDPPSLNTKDADPSGRSRVLPEAALPSIRSRPLPPADRPQSSPSTRPAATPAPTTAASDRLPTAASVLDSPVSAPRRSAKKPAPVPVASVSEAKARQLEDEIEQLFKQINRLQQNRRELTGHALSLLRESRAILQTEPERYGRAEYNVRQVRSILDRTRDARRRSIRYGVLLLVYLALWLAVCAGAITSLFLYAADMQSFLAATLGADSRLVANAVPMFWAILGGAAGGVLGAVASLLVHIRQGQEFDRQYVLRYTIQPIMGVVLALSIYFLCSFFANAIEIDLTSGQISSIVPAVIAFPAGLWQEMVYALLYRLTGVFRIGSRRR
ncbi:MAG: hypothetical protein R2873_34650 [Caldilineaceae bacterium]